MIRIPKSSRQGVTEYRSSVLEMHAVLSDICFSLLSAPCELHDDSVSADSSRLCTRPTTTTARAQLRAERERRPQLGVGACGRVRQLVLFCRSGGHPQLSKLSPELACPRNWPPGTGRQLSKLSPELAGTRPSPELGPPGTRPGRTSAVFPVLKRNKSRPDPFPSFCAANAIFVNDNSKINVITFFIVTSFMCT